MNKLLIFGTSNYAEVMKCYFSDDSEYEVVAFVESASYIDKEELDGLPVVAFEEINHSHPPENHEIYIAVGFSHLNAVRKRFYEESKEKGYKLASYINSGVKIWDNNILGDHVCIFEDNTIQPYAEIGSNTVLWCGNHIGHHTKIGDDCFIASHIVLSGHSEIGESSFVGVNVTLRDDIKVGKSNILGAGAIILDNTKDYEVYPGSKTSPISKLSYEIDF